jgi:hypothetical protein
MQASLSMRRLAAVTAIVFVLVLAFLAGRVRAGADPTQASAPPSSTAAPSDPGVSPPAYGAPGDSVDPYGGGSVDPYGGGSAVPDGDPPVTHAS